MLSLEERIELLESDLNAVPMRISVYHDLPFAILRYEPEREWDVRRQARQLATRLQQTGKQVRFLSLAKLLWQVIDQTEGLDAVVDLEQRTNRSLSVSPAGSLPRRIGTLLSIFPGLTSNSLS